MQQFRRLTALSAVVVVLVGCPVQESTRNGGLVAPTGPAVTALSPAPTVVTVTAQSTAAPPASPAAPAAPAASTGEPTASTGEPTAPTGEQNSETSAPAPTAPETLGSPPEVAGAASAREVLAAADPPEGFGEGVLGVTGPTGMRVWPVVIADTPAAQQRGLMGVTDFAALGGYAAMVFIFEGDTSGAFWMRDTPLPLRITFVTASGSVVSGTDMVPCLPPTPAGDCERYHPDGPYRIAIEHPLSPAFDIGLAAAEFVEVTVE